ncbi:arsenate reductase ArsC [Pseudazoarcus pumilus]|uniref:Protein-tyrosine-phosphatase n=1 Tax=Pseudazoarcus pumilus TaxID=2067960 RepID=A0A2I6S3D2_9RHOO|nr:arsenate reductase ArsC [Pseudazoarcus pumilus]AUN93727.1 protein-tyrosine-phosphatase [Pseudazoarcus pumilus]
MSDGQTYNVLFLCTANSARSVLAESLLAELGRGRFNAFSAGSFPRGQVHPMTLEVLQQLQLPVDGLRSKSWDEFTGTDAPQMDFIFTVCDSAAGEACPVWPGHPATAHWGVPDPAFVDGDADAQCAAFLEAARVLKRRIELFLSLPLARLDTMSLQHELRAIGQR